MARKDFVFTSESVTEGHPDKVADGISDAVLDAHLAGDKFSRVACETLVSTGMVVIAGEITSNVTVPLTGLVGSHLHRHREELFVLFGYEAAHQRKNLICRRHQAIPPAATWFITYCSASMPCQWLTELMRRRVESPEGGEVNDAVRKARRARRNDVHLHGPAALASPTDGPS